MTDSLFAHLTAEEQVMWERCQAATKGPWHSKPGYWGVNGMQIRDEAGLRIASVTHKADKPIPQKKADAELIAQTRTDFPTVLTALAEARQQTQELRTQLGAWHSVFKTTQLTHAADRLETAERQLQQAQQERDRAQEDAAHKEMDAFNLSQRLATVQQQRQQAQAALQKCLDWLLLGNHDDAPGWIEARDAVLKVLSSFTTEGR